VSSAFAKVDTDGDGQLSTSELTNAVTNAHGHHHGHGGAPPSASDAANSIISAFNTDGADGLSLDEVTSALGGQSSSSALSSTFASLDADGDGILSAQELSAAIQSQLQAAQAAYAAHMQDQAATSLVGTTA